MSRNQSGPVLVEQADELYTKLGRQVRDARNEDRKTTQKLRESNADAENVTKAHDAAIVTAMKDLGDKHKGSKYTIVRDSPAVFELFTYLLDFEDHFRPTPFFGINFVYGTCTTNLEVRGNARTQQRGDTHTGQVATYIICPNGSRQNHQNITRG